MTKQTRKELKNENENDSGLLHFVRNDEQTATARRHCNERSDEATQRKIQNSKFKIKE
jgi:hypothetical protein